MSKIKTNYVFLLSYNLFVSLAPLLVTPYTSRVLGPEALGIFSYCSAISTYFISIGLLGTPVLGKREIAKYQDDKEKVKTVFTNIAFLQIIFLTVTTLIYVIYVFAFGKYTQMSLICGIGIVSSLFDITWAFIGLEKMKNVAIRNFAVKLLTVVLIFTLVKESSHLYHYAAIMMLSNLVVNCISFMIAIKMIGLEKPTPKSVSGYFIPALTLLLPSTVVFMYAVIDKSLIGTLATSISEVGYYDQAQKIISACLGISTTLGTVLMPRLTFVFNNNGRESLSAYIKKGLHWILIINTPICFGLAVESSVLVPWFFGPGYIPVIGLLVVLAPMIILGGIFELIGTNLLIATNNEKQLLRLNVISCIINIILDILLISKWNAVGAAVATVIAEIIKIIATMIYCKKNLFISLLDRESIKPIVSSVIMFLILYFLRENLFDESTILNCCLLTLIGLTTYFFCMILLSDNELRAEAIIVKNRIMKVVKAR